MDLILQQTQRMTGQGVSYVTSNPVRQQTIVTINITGSDNEITEWLKHFVVLKSSENVESYVYRHRLLMDFMVPTGSSIIATTSYHTDNTDTVTGQIWVGGNVGTPATLHAGDFYHGVSISNYIGSNAPIYDESLDIKLTDSEGTPIDFGYWFNSMESEGQTIDSDIRNYCDNGTVPRGTAETSTDGTASDTPKKPDVLSDDIPEKDSIYDTDVDVDVENQNYNNDKSDEVQVEQRAANAAAGGIQYNLMTSADICSFFNWYWNDIIKAESISDWLLNSITHLYGNLSNCILGLKYSPVALDQLISSGTQGITLGRFATNLSAPYFTGEHVGRLIYVAGEVSGITNNFLDTSPYTQAYLYLPFYGFAPCDINKYLHRGLEFELLVDARSGMARWQIRAFIGDSEPIIDYYDFQLMVEQPITLDDGSRIAQGMIDSLASVASGIPVAGAVAQTVKGLNASNGSTISAHSTVGSMLSTVTTNAIYLVRVQPQYYLPSDMPNTVGRITRQTYKVKDLKGFCVFENVKINYGKSKNHDGTVISPTEDDMNEIVELMEKGIMLDRIVKE